MQIGEIIQSQGMICVVEVKRRDIDNKMDFSVTDTQHS